MKLEMPHSPYKPNSWRDGWWLEGFTSSKNSWCPYDPDDGTEQAEIWAEGYQAKHGEPY